jgi:YegS/Rv2252/BmrU family lipid kinase
MDFANVHFIINPSAGKDEPILSYLQKAFVAKDINWHCTVTHTEGETLDAAKSLRGQTDLVAAYGGDGTVAQVARGLRGSMTPMAIIPGGTANVFAKELGIPQDTEKAIRLISEGPGRLVRADMGEANGASFLLRINLGIMAGMVIDADAHLKETLGQAAYAVAGLKKIASERPVSYKLLIDGEEMADSGVALTVTNAGNIGIGDLAFLPDISIYDGLLDVILLREAGVASLLKVAGSTLFHKDSATLQHWRCKSVRIEMEEPADYILDDQQERAAVIDIRVVPDALHILIPCGAK